MCFEKCPVNELINDNHQREEDQKRAKDKLHDVLSRRSVKELNWSSIGIDVNYLKNIDSQSDDIVTIIPEISEIRKSEA